MKSYMRLAVVVLALSSLAFAHGSNKHVKGTVEKVNADSIVVKSTENETLTISFNSATQWERDKVAGGPKDLLPGARVIIDMPETGEKRALRVRYSNPKKPSSARKKATSK